MACIPKVQLIVLALMVPILYSPAYASTIIDENAVSGLALGDRHQADDGQSNGYFDKLVTLASAIPEPASWALLTGGFVLVGSVVRRRKSPSVTD